MLIGIMLLPLGSPAAGQTVKKKLSARQALEPFNDLIGEWKATGVLKGKPPQAKDSFWTETHNWVWKFKGEDAWVKVTIHKGKYFTSGELRYLPDKGEYQFTLQTIDNKTVVFTGTYEDRWLTMYQEDRAAKETQKLVIRLLHSNRFLYQYDVLPDGKAFYTRIYQVGATKLGEEFASGDGRPVCIVTGGLGTIKVAFQGESYYVCCSGCRDEFLSNPQKYIAAAKKKMK
jgi:YHS domain-containing protein